MVSAATTIAVVNAGGWGTALAIKLANQGHAVRLWARRSEMAACIARDRENARYLPGVVLPAAVDVTSDLTAAVAGAEVVVVAAIAGYLRELAGRLRPLLVPDTLILHGTKGFEPDSWRTPAQVLAEELGPSLTGHIAALGGPTHAEEVARHLPTAAVIACANAETASRLQALFATTWFRVYTNPDVVGVELCSAAKNVIAIAAGIGDGLGYGDNSKAALMTRALAEMWRLVEQHGGSFATIAGLAGVGDVIATCTSRHSRNRWAGEQLGRGVAPEEVVASTPMVIEGFPSARAMVALAQHHGVEMPICEGVHRILFGGQRPDEALRELLARGSTSEA